ncbi:MAG TPA: hypothetical protein VF772_21105 [Terriglobales bacterium]
MASVLLFAVGAAQQRADRIGDILGRHAVLDRLLDGIHHDGAQNNALVVHEALDQLNDGFVLVCHYRTLPGVTSFNGNTVAPYSLPSHRQPSATALSTGASTLQRLNMIDHVSGRDPFHRVTGVISADLLNIKFRDGGESQQLNVAVGEMD